MWYKFEQWHINSVYNKESLIENKYIFVFTLFAINEDLFKNVTISILGR